MATAADAKKLHYDLVNVGLRAQATAAGLVQLCRELQRVGVIDEAAVDRVKTAITSEICHAAPRHQRGTDYRSQVRTRLDSIFVGEQAVGDAAELRASVDG